MKMSKRILSSVLALLMVLSVCSAGFTVSAAESSNSSILDEVVLEPIARPQVEFYCTEVTRVAAAANSLEPGAEIVKATPSGVPELSGSYVSQAYAGETPAATRVTFVTPTVGISITGFSCNNETVVFSPMQYEAPGTYYVDIVSGTVNKNEDGSIDPLIFTIDYVWTDGKTYQEKCVSFVENIVNGGSYVEAQSEIQALSGTGSYYRLWASASTRILGKGVYYEQPASIVTSTSDPYRSYGTYNVATGTQTENVAAGYNTSLFADDKTDKPAGKMNQANEFTVPGTTLAHVYVDASAATTLADINLRFNANVGALSDRNNSNPYTAIADAWVSTGSNVDNIVTTNDAAAEAAIGFTIPAKADYGVKQYSENTAMTTVTGGAGQYQHLYTAPFTGTVANLVDGSSYTITTKYYSYMWVEKGLLQHYNMTSAATVPTSITFHVVDKGALREMIDFVMNSDPDSPAVRNAKKGINPQSWYYKSGFSNFQTQYVEALNMLNNPKATQSEIDSQTTALQKAYNNLQLKTADYTQVDALEVQAEAIVDNADCYPAEDVALVEEALKGVKTNYNVLYQGAVDTMAKNLDTAIKNANPNPANYEEIYSLKNAFDALHEEDYTPDSWKAVEDAFAAVKYTHNALEQATVDAYADAIDAAMGNLTLVSELCDWLAFNKALADAKAVNTDLYKNPEALIAAIEAAEEAKADNDISSWPIEKQDVVDALKDDLVNAKAALQLKDANKVALKAAIDAEIPGNRDYYDQDILAAYEALVAEGTEMYNDATLTINDQATVNAKAAAITAKYEELMNSYEVPQVDKTALVDALAKAEEVVVENYEDDDAMAEFNAAVAAGEEILAQDLEVGNEQIVADAAQRIEDAIIALNKKPVNLSALDALKEQLAALKNETIDVTTYVDGELGSEAKAKYDAEAIDAILAEIDSFDTTGFDVEDQATVDAFVEEINADITALEVLAYDEYLAVAVAEYESYEDPSIYTTDSWGAYETAYNEAKALTDAAQADINTALTNLVNAKGELALAAFFDKEEGTTTIIDRENGIIYGLSDEGIEDIEDYIEYAGGTVEYVETDNGFGTGTVVNFMVAGEVYESYEIIIFGDLTGDGVVDTFDYATLAAIVNGDINVEEGSAIYKAADLYVDDSVDTFDLAVLAAYVNGELEISQTPELA